MKSLGTAVNKVEDVSSRSNRISQKLDSMELPDSENGEDKNMIEFKTED